MTDRIQARIDVLESALQVEWPQRAKVTTGAEWIEDIGEYLLNMNAERLLVFEELLAFLRRCDIDSVVALRDLLHFVHVAGEHSGLTGLVGAPSMGEFESLDRVIGRVCICRIPQEARTAWDHLELGQRQVPGE